MKSLRQMTLVAITIILSCCSASKEKKVYRFLSDVGGRYPSVPVDLRMVDQPSDAIQGDFIEFVMVVDPSDIPTIESSFGFTLNDGQVISKSSRISPSYPWIVSVSRRSLGTKAEVSIIARQPN